MNIERITADTFYEANCKAELLYGKDNYEIIKSSKEHISSAFGLVRTEIVVLLVKQKEKRLSSIIKVAPTLPSESIEATPNVLEVSKHPIKQATNIESRIKQKPASNKTPNISRTYSRNAKITPMRETHTLRTNQEGISEPKAQKIDEFEDNTASLLRVLNNIRQKNTIEKQMPTRRCAGESRQSAMYDNQPTFAPANNVAEQIQYDILEKKFEQLLKKVDIIYQTTDQIANKQDHEIPQGLLKIKENLLSLDTPHDITDKIISELKFELSTNALQDPDKAYQEARIWFENKLKFSPQISFTKIKKPHIIVLVGPTGVGKTTTIAKLSAHYGLSSFERKSVALFTLDTFRIAATEQLSQYAKIIDIEVEVILKPEDIDEALARHQDKELIIVDTAGRGQKDTNEIRELSKFIEKLPTPEKYLVVSATSKYVDILEATKSFSVLNYDKFIFTKLDETNTIGPLLAILYSAVMSFFYLTNGQCVPNDFKEATFSVFHETLFQTNLSSVL